MKIWYNEFNPSEALKPYVDCYWSKGFDSGLNVEPPLQRCVPLGITEIIFHIDGQDCHVLSNGEWKKLPDAFVVGVYKDVAIWKAAGKCKVFGVRLKPEAFLYLFNIPLTSLANNYVDIHTFFGKDMGHLTNKILGDIPLPDMIAVFEQFLLSHVHRVPRRPAYFAEGTRLIRESKGNISLDELAATLCISERQLQRHFKDGIGMGPKAYLRIIRFRSAYEFLQHHEGSVSWANLSYSCGYADQAHFIRDFKQFTGEVPTAMISNSEHFTQMHQASAN